MMGGSAEKQINRVGAGCCSIQKRHANVELTLIESSAKLIARMLRAATIYVEPLIYTSAMCRRGHIKDETRKNKIKGI